MLVFVAGPCAPFANLHGFTNQDKAQYAASAFEERTLRNWRFVLHPCGQALCQADFPCQSQFPAALGCEPSDAPCPKGRFCNLHFRCISGEVGLCRLGAQAFVGCPLPWRAVPGRQNAALKCLLLAAAGSRAATGTVPTVDRSRQACQHRQI